MKKFIQAIFGLSLAFMVAITPALATRTQLTPVSPTVGTGGVVTAGSADLTFTAADTVNNNAVKLTGREIVLVWNTGASPYTVTFTSVADSLGRTGDIAAYSVAASTISCFGVFTLPGWYQADGNLYVSASNVAVKFCVIKVPTNI